MRLNDVLELAILGLSPLIVLVGVIFAGYIWGRQVAQGKNGIYKAIVYTSLFFGIEWGLVILFYVMDGSGYYKADNWVGLGVRLYRVLLAVYCLLNIAQWHIVLSKEE